MAISFKKVTPDSETFWVHYPDRRKWEFCINQDTRMFIRSVYDNSVSWHEVGNPEREVTEYVDQLREEVGRGVGKLVECKHNK